jgi:hypothetical protein
VQPPAAETIGRNHRTQQAHHRRLLTAGSLALNATTHFHPTQPSPNAVGQASTVTVNFDTFGFSASAGADYVPRSGTLTFAAGETQKTVTVSVLDDPLVEFDETFSLILSNPTNAVLGGVPVFGQYQAIVTIIDNDQVGPLGFDRLRARACLGSSGRLVHTS